MLATTLSSCAARRVVVWTHLVAAAHPFSIYPSASTTATAITVRSMRHSFTTTCRRHDPKDPKASFSPASASSSSRPARPRPTPPPPPFPTVATCPSPTCPCAETPALPDGLEIDHDKPLNGVMTGYAEQVLVCTGSDDWPSRIEDEHSGDNLAADLKELFGRGGKYTDPFHNISILNSSFPASSPPPQQAGYQNSSAYLLPSFKYAPLLPRVSFDSVEALAEGYLLPEKLHPMHDSLSPIHRDRLTRKPAYQDMLYGVRDVDHVMVLICGHGGRDARCGIFGPVLRDEFERVLPEHGVQVLTGPVPTDAAGADERPRLTSEGDENETNDASASTSMSARVGLISHIGGHKYAGNVIIYVPPQAKLAKGKEHPLAGKGIWLGRVEPKHVDGIVKEMILEGRVIEDMFRGGIDQDRKILRM